MFELTCRRKVISSYQASVLASDSPEHHRKHLFRGEFARGGNYEFRSAKGDITIRIPGNSAFSLVAASPTRQIELGQFWNSNFKTNDGRKFVGDVGDGRSSVSVTNFSGSILLAQIGLH